MSPRHRAVALVSAAGVLLGSSSAFAYCRTTTCLPGEDCQSDGSCIVSGIPLFWPESCISFAVQEDGSKVRNISYEATHSIVKGAFDKWVNAHCEDGGHPSLGVRDYGAAQCAQPEYNQQKANANVWMYQDDAWPYVGVNATLALTTVTFNTQTGEILDADVEINSFRIELTVDEPVRFDLESIVTHEAGHFLGLSHSYVSGATMFPSYDAGDTGLRDLGADDVAGICAAYPEGRAARKSDCSPRRGFSSVCGAEQAEDDSGCAVRTPGKGRLGSSSAALVLSLLAFAAGFRRRSGKPR